MRAESVQLAQQKISHPGIIGDMYEGLARHLLALVIPEGLDLHVSSGVITNSRGERSRQIDCMITIGEGNPIPYTTHREHRDKDVIAVIEVKKSLYSKDVQSAYTNLTSVFDVCDFHEMDGEFGLLRDSYRGITRRILPSPQEARELPFHLQMIYHTLVVEACKPVRVMLGYDGFTSEVSLRAHYAKFIEKNVFRSGYSPARFPSLIMCGSYSLIKLNGMPFAAAMMSEFWDFYASSSTNAALLLLECLFTRISYLTSTAPDFFGDDLELEILNPLFRGICVQRANNRPGWVMVAVDLSEKELEQAKATVQWEPARLNEVQFVVVNMLCMWGDLPLDSPDLSAFLADHNYSAETLVDELRDLGLATVDRGALAMLTDGCATVITPDGHYYAAENKSGRLTRWVQRRIGELKNKNPHRLPQQQAPGRTE
jgi:hypothetical protein